jgi:hypothetical protein
VKVTAAIAIMYLVVVPLAIVGVAVGAFWETDRLARQTHSALCTFRTDLQQRADASAAYLERTKGDIILGTFRVTRAALIVTVNNQEKTLESLDSLHC